MNVGLKRSTGVGAGREVEIFSVFVEDRIAAVAHAIGHLRRFAIGEGIDMNRCHIIFQPPGVGQPFAVR